MPDIAKTASRLPGTRLPGTARPRTRLGRPMSKKAARAGTMIKANHRAGKALAEAILVNKLVA